jgi:glycosyltransferase involved in cell wall biosynthesis
LNAGRNLRWQWLGVVFVAPGAAVLATVLLRLRILDALPALIVLAVVWAAFVLQLLSGRSGRAFLAYGRLRARVLNGNRARRSGERRSVPGRVPGRSGLPRLAWSHDGWAHADGFLVGLDLLAEEFDITVFGTQERLRGEPPVALELLPAVTHGSGLRLEGLEARLRDFDVVWAGGSFEGTTWQALEARAAGGPAVVSTELENIAGNYGGPTHPLRARSVREVDHFCATSTTAASLLELDGVEEDRISLVPWVVEMQPYTHAERLAARAEARQRFRLDDDDVVCLFLGRLVWEKGLHTLAAAIAWLDRIEMASRLRLLVAGEGEYERPFRALLKHYGAHDRVRLVGNLDPAGRRAAFAAADLQVVPSLPTAVWSEQFGRVIPEGMHYGLPIVGSASGAIPEVVGDAGVIVPPGDHGALAGALVDLYEDGRRKQLSEVALDRAHRVYSVERFVERVAAALRKGMLRRGRMSA